MNKRKQTQLMDIENTERPAGLKNGEQTTNKDVHSWETSVKMFNKMPLKQQREVTAAFHVGLKDS